MNAVSDSSPLIILSKLCCLDLLGRVFSTVDISGDVHNEVVVAGARLPGAAEVSKARWIELKELLHPEELPIASQKYFLDAGEMSTIPGKGTRPTLGFD